MVVSCDLGVCLEGGGGVFLEQLGQVEGLGRGKAQGGVIRTSPASVLTWTARPYFML